MKCASCSKNSDDADNYPKNIEYGIGEISFQERTPREHYCVDSVEDPNEHERAGGTKPAYQAKTKYPHQNTYEFNCANLTENECIHDKHMPFRIDGNQVQSNSVYSPI